MMVLSEKLNYDVTSEIESLIPTNFGTVERLRQIVPVWIRRCWGNIIKIPDDEMTQESDSYTFTCGNYTYYIFKAQDSEEYCYQHNMMGGDNSTFFASRLADIAQEWLTGEDSAQYEIEAFESKVSIFLYNLKNVYATFGNNYHTVYDDFDPDMEEWIIARK
jgi:hypothetical protein